MKFWSILLAIAMVSAGVHTADADTEITMVSSEGDLVEILESAQLSIQAVSPPSADIFVTEKKMALPVEWSGFDKKTTKYMTAAMDEYGLPRYSLLLWEDASTRERVISLVSTGYEVARIPAPEDYLPETFYQNFLSRGGTYNEFMSWIFDPAHTATVIELIPETLYSAYEQYEAEKFAHEELLAALQEEMLIETPEEDNAVTMGISFVPAVADKIVEDEMALSSELLESGMVATTMSSPPAPPSSTNTVPGTGGSSSNLVAQLGISIPEGFGTMGHIEVFVKESLIYSTNWIPAEGGMWIPTPGQQTVYWSDPVTNVSERFFLVTDATDSDSDGYSDLYEEWAGTEPLTNDAPNVDNDLYSDWLELKIFGDLSQTETNDFDSDGLLNNEELICDADGNPIAMISDPALADSDDEGLNDYQERRVWFTDAMDPDTDDDGRDDEAEVLGSPPSNPHDPDVTAPAVAFFVN